MISDIEEVLRRSMGLKASTIGTSTVEQVVRARMAIVGAHTTEEYLRRLRDAPGELDELIEAVVVPESWFFRDGAPFAALARWVREHWLPAHPTGTLRVLTVPCSTGEEPYSVAMTLLGRGAAAGSLHGGRGGHQPAGGGARATGRVRRQLISGSVTRFPGPSLRADARRVRARGGSPAAGAL